MDEHILGFIPQKVEMSYRFHFRKLNLKTSFDKIMVKFESLLSKRQVKLKV